MLIKSLIDDIGPDNKVIPSHLADQTLVLQGLVFEVRLSKAEHIYFRMKAMETLPGANTAGFYETPFQLYLNKNLASSLDFIFDEMKQVEISGCLSLYRTRVGFNVKSVKFLPDAYNRGLDRQAEDLAVKLRNNGVFDKVMPLPRKIKSVCVISGSNAKAMTDLQHVFDKSRKTQGNVQWVAAYQKNASEILKEFKRVDESRAFELIVLTRGGGDYEGLMPYNDEALIRAVANAKTPTLSAIGHAADKVVIQYATSQSESTPSTLGMLINRLFDGLDDKSYIELNRRTIQSHYFADNFSGDKHTQTTYTEYYKQLENIEDRINRAVEAKLSERLQYLLDQKNRDDNKREAQKRGGEARSNPVLDGIALVVNSLRTIFYFTLRLGLFFLRHPIFSLVAGFILWITVYVYIVIPWRSFKWSREAAQYKYEPVSRIPVLRGFDLADLNIATRLEPGSFIRIKDSMDVYYHAIYYKTFSQAGFTLDSGLVSKTDVRPIDMDYKYHVTSKAHLRTPILSNHWLLTVKPDDDFAVLRKEKDLVLIQTKSGYRGWLKDVFYK